MGACVRVVWEVPPSRGEYLGRTCVVNSRCIVAHHNRITNLHDSPPLGVMWEGLVSFETDRSRRNRWNIGRTYPGFRPWDGNEAATNRQRTEARHPLITLLSVFKNQISIHGERDLHVGNAGFTDVCLSFRIRSPILIPSSSSSCGPGP